MEKRTDYPIGEQNFEKIVTGDWLYVDKTGFLRYFLKGGYFFLGRPRRFGKSLFLSTLRYFFEGRKDLFEGLQAGSFDWDWASYPVLYIDINVGDYSDSSTIYINLDNHLRQWEEKYDIRVDDSDISLRFSKIIRIAHEKTGRRVVVLVDEYDKPLVNSIDHMENFEKYRKQLSSFYSNFKSGAEHIHLVFLTGVSRFGKVNVFSGLNNIQDLSTLDRFNEICGITDREIDYYFKMGIEEFAIKRNMKPDEVRARLKDWYDGYHFSDSGEDIYNPFSLLCSMNEQRFDNYWIESGGKPTILLNQLKRFDIDLQSLFHTQCTRSSLYGLELDSPRPVALFYQTGYLTIKDYDEDVDLFTLGLPNREVKRGLLDYLLPYYADLHNEESAFVVKRFVEEFRKGDVDGFMRRLRSLFAAVPYQMEMESERNVHNALLMLMMLVGLEVRTEMQTSEGRIDLFVKTDRYYYIIELKLDGSAEQALTQINEKNYSLPFEADNREIIKIGVNFSTASRTIAGWVRG